MFGDNIARRIVGFSGNLPDVEWEELYGRTLVFKAYQFVTCGGNTEGGYVYLYREHAAGWHEWRRTRKRNWAESGVSYERALDGQMAYKWFDDG